MQNEIVSTQPSLPQVVVSNGAITGNALSNPNNILLPDDQFAESGSGVASDIIIGNFAWLNGGIPNDAVITGFEITLIGKRGAQTVPPLAVQIYAVDNTSGSDVFWPFDTTFTSFTETNDEYVIGNQNYLFNTTWNADMANNFKLQLVTDGNIFFDTALVNVFYYVPIPPTPPTPVTSGCLDCDSPLQIPEMFLELPFLIGETKFYIQRGLMAYADGTPVRPGDMGTCGGDLDLVFDEGKRKQNGQDFMENVKIPYDRNDVNTPTWTVLPNGVVEFDIKTVNNRGLKFFTPGDHDATLMSDHAANSRVVVSNNLPFYLRFVRRCEVDLTFSAPIDGLDEGNTVVTAMHKINFIGANVQASANIIDPQQLDVAVISSPTNLEPIVEDTSTGTTGTTPAISLTTSHTIVSANYLRVWISTENETINSVTYNGVAMTLVGAQTNVGANLKVALYELVTPTVGVHDVVVTMANPVNISSGGVSFLNVDIANPTDTVSAGAFGNGTDPSDSITTTIDNVVIQDVVGTVTNATAFAQTGLFAINGQVNAASRPGASSSRRVLAPANITDTYTINPSGDWAIILAGIRGITSPLGGVQSVTDDGNGVVGADNTDPANPVITFSLANLITQLLASASFIAGLVSNLINNNSFINGLTSNALFQTNVNTFVSGSGDLKKVGVGATSDIGWFNMQILFGDQWTGSASPTSQMLTHFNSSDEQIHTNTTAFADIFRSNGKQVILAFAGSQDTQELTESYIGFFQNGGSTGMRFTNNIVSLGFITDASGNWYVRAANGAARTQTAISAPADETMITWRIEYDPANATPQARFYIEGVLVGTITTNLPTEGNITGVAFINANSTSKFENAFAPSVAIEI